MNYDDIKRYDGIDYGFIEGNHQIVFIKVGLGGSYLGYENKYLRMAHRLKEKYGCSVIVASNPHDGKSHADMDKQMLEEYILSRKLGSAEIFFFGNSNGGIKGLELANAGVAFKKMILVNMPLMINFHKTRKYILAIPGTEIVAIYGGQDPSFPYLPFIRERFANLKAFTFPNADHNFKGFLDDFINFSDLLISN